MAKRFIDTLKYKKRFIRNLPSPYKIFWDYLCCNCDNAGIWHVDFEVARVETGERSLNEQKALTLFADKIMPFDNNEKWYLTGFIEFQYNCLPEKLNPANKAHGSVINILDKYNILGLMAKGHNKPLASPLQEAMDKDKDMDKDKYKDMDKAFSELWELYPNKDGRKQAYKHFEASVKNEQDFKNIKSALDNYLNSQKVRNGFIKNGSTWFNNWQDWIPKEAPVKKPFTIDDYDALYGGVAK